jgi:hypothetical protein
MSKVALLFVLVLASCAAFGSAANVYVTQSGAASGLCQTGVQNEAWLTNSANWGSGSAQVGPGTTVLLCGTFTGTGGTNSAITFLGAGTSGNPVTFKFDVNAVMTSPYWGSSSTGAITCNGYGYVVVDGGTNGAIMNTANGTALANHQSSYGVYFQNCPNSEIKNLAITGIYANQGYTSANNCTLLPNSAGCDTAGANTADIYLAEGNSSNTLIHGNTLSNARSGVLVDYENGTTATGLQIYNNHINDHGWSIAIGADNYNSVSTGILIYGNAISDWSNWQFPSGTYHTDGIIAYDNADNGGQPTQITALTIYNNSFTGTLGSGSPTGYIACGNATACTVFNNLMVDTGSYTCDGYVWFYAFGGPNYFYNNTVVGSSALNGTAVNMNVSLYSVTSGHWSTANIRNNVFVNIRYGISGYEPTLAQFESDIVASNHNVWNYSTSPSTFVVNVGSASPDFYSFAQWLALAPGYDANSSTASANLNSSYVPQTGSAAIGRGQNLTGFLAALDYDMTGASRPATGVWDSGALNSGSAPTMYLLSTSTTGTGSGTVSGCAGNYLAYAAWSCILTPSGGSSLAGATGCGGTLAAATISGTMPASACTVTATFNAASGKCSAISGQYSTIGLATVNCQ